MIDLYIVHMCILESWNCDILIATESLVWRQFRHFCFTSWRHFSPSQGFSWLTLPGVSLATQLISSLAHFYNAPQNEWILTGSITLLRNEDPVVFQKNVTKLTLLSSPSLLKCIPAPFSILSSSGRTSYQVPTVSIAVKESRWRTAIKPNYPFT